jgi:phenylalanyl-tRNA synthetase beta chain
MRIPLSWLTSMVDVDLTLDALVERLSASGLEVEGVTRPGSGVHGVRTARVLHHEPHPDADNLRLVDVTGPDGDGQVRVVCGATNFTVGDVVLHAAVGAEIPGLTLEARKIRGEVSNGMLASARELGLGDDHAGLLILDADVPLGAALDELVPIGEPVIEIAVQPDRGDHLSIRGVARDLAALLDTTLRAPLPSASTPGAAGIPVTLTTDAVGAFVAWTLEGATVRRSPLWLRTRLAQCGLRSIDGVVDVTNYVMLELGQPLHAFDLDRVAEGRLIVRDAGGGELLRTLDGVDRTLVAGDVLIEDADGPASLAGVMGGERTEVHAGTRRILLEGAVWDPSAIRRTSRRLGLVSEASTRFERRVDPEAAGEAVARAAQLMAETAGAVATAATAVAGTQGAWLARSPVSASSGRIAELLALDLDATSQAALLRRAGCAVEVEGDRLEVTAPSWRGDLERPADLAEEIARLHGFAHIPAVLPPLVARGGRSASQRRELALRDAVLAHGFDEVVTRPFVGVTSIAGVVPSEGRVRLANPLAQDAAAMRPGLLDGLLATLRRNRGQGRPGLAVVELGRIHRPVGDPLGVAVDGLLGDGWRWTGPDGQPLPLQPRALGLAAYGLRHGPGWLDERSTWEVADVIAAFDELARRANTGPLERRPVERDGWHPGRTVQLLLGGFEVGVAGQLHPSEADRWDLPDPVVAGEFLTEILLATDVRGRSTDGVATAPVLVRHPAVVVDVAVVAPESVTVALVGETIRAAAGTLLDELWWFDEFRGDQLPDGHRSVAFRLRLQDAVRQLSDADADGVLSRVADAVAGIGAALRA